MFHLFLWSALVSGVVSDVASTPSWSGSLNSSINHTPRQGVFPGYLLRNMENLPQDSVTTLTLSPANTSQSAPEWLAEGGFTHYRLVPGIFLNGMDYHFDGLATVMKFSFKQDSSVGVQIKPYASEVFNDPKGCIVYETGTGPTLGYKICFRNPVVNLLPINDQLWLTIDTYAWGRIDPDTLDTFPSNTNLHTLTMNAHPACDYNTKECFVQHPCSSMMLPLSSDVCISKLNTTDGDLQGIQLAHLNTPSNMLLQHSHSPCITENFVVSKLDSFGARFAPSYAEGGLLKGFHQVEGNLWMTMNRKTQEARFLTSNFSFVNNHFWNCYENDNGDVVVDTVTATDGYLDAYFQQRLQQSPLWDQMFHAPKRCVVPASGDQIGCEDLLDDSSLIFDYPTYNPNFKMNKNYNWFYAISPSTRESHFFDRIIKVDAQKRSIAVEFSRPGFYFTEADFVPRPGSTVEDDGVLLSVFYDSHSDTSSLAVLNAQNLEVIAEYLLDEVVPFHAHGIVCSSAKCFTNP
eukprot:TRINITY_DN4288_c0_g1_i1.p1 TRINITY_DN4288_c0_g1~~TRINITY_DN4288_c0_g1_i1.p1  ORF type:complete len:518 (+),score=133.07 TRINITY_DN4288_c0_g1_i1:92-1645(+)